MPWHSEMLHVIECGARRLPTLRYEKVETLLHQCSCILWSRSCPRYGASKDRTVSAPYRAERHPLVSVNSHSSDLLAFHDSSLRSAQEEVNRY